MFVASVAFAFMASAGLEIATDTVTNATNISSLATKNSGLVAEMATRFSVLMMNIGHFLKYVVLLKNYMGRPLLKKHSK